MLAHKLGTLPQCKCTRSKREDLIAGFATLKCHGKSSPYVAGDSLTLADPAARELLQRLGENPNVQAITRARDAATPGFNTAVRAKYHSKQ